MPFSSWHFSEATLEERPCSPTPMQRAWHTGLVEEVTHRRTGALGQAVILSRSSKGPRGHSE